MTKTMLPRCLMRHRLTLNRHFSSLSNTTKVPVLYKSPQINDSNHNDTITLQLFSWGRGASGQLGGGIEEIRLYPAPVANLQLPPSSFTLSPTPGQLVDNSNKKGVTEVGISCGLFHSAILADGHFWMWGKGDGGRLGFGHENPAFLPTLNPFFGFRSLYCFGRRSFCCNHFPWPHLYLGLWRFRCIGTLCLS